MRRGSGALVVVAGLLAAALAAGASALAAPGPEFRITVDREEVVFGEGFPVTVVRAWGAGLVPEPWSDDALAPLVTRTLEATRREEGGRTVETLRLRAHVFRLDGVRLDAPRFTARPPGGGPPTVAIADPVVLRVRPSLDPADPGPVEFPGGPLPVPGSRLPWILGGAAAAAALALLAAARRRRAAPAPAPAPLPPPPPAEPPHVRALRALAALRTGIAEDPAAVRAFHEEAAGLVRVYLAESTGVATGVRTSEEILVAAAAVPAVGGAPLALLRVVLGRCDLVKFARALPGAPERARLLDDVEAFVRGTAPASGGRAAA